MLLFDEENKTDVPDNLITEFFDPTKLKTLLYHCLSVEIPDNNDKAEMILHLLPNIRNHAKGFDELGTGTNRIGLLYNGFVIKIALDRRGLVDNFNEFKRSNELPMYLAKTYETNYLINITEYTTIMDQDQFILNEPTIKTMLKDISKGYLFDDIGFTLKNCCNWGFRDAPEGHGELELCIIDSGYLYPLIGQDQNNLFRCPKCNGKMTWDSNFTYFKCRSNNCGYKMKPSDIRDRMTTDFEDIENKTLYGINHIKTPNLKDIEKVITKISKGDTI